MGKTYKTENLNNLIKELPQILNDDTLIFWGDIYLGDYGGYYATIYCKSSVYDVKLYQIAFRLLDYSFYPEHSSTFNGVLDKHKNIIISKAKEYVIHKK